MQDMKVTVMNPLLDGRGVWQGDTPGTIRKRYYCFGTHNSKDFCSNVTVYNPGEGCVFHNHPQSEELGYVIAGSTGLAIFHRCIGKVPCAWDHVNEENKHQDIPYQQDQLL